MEKQNKQSGRRSASEMSAESDSYMKRKEIAQVKYAVIAPVITGTLNGESNSAYYKRLEDIDIKFPDGSVHRFKFETFRYWVYLYRKFGFEGLIPRSRSDCGKSRRLSQNAKDFIHDQISRYPKITGQLIHDRMVAEGVIEENEVSVDTVQRYIARNGLRSGHETPSAMEKKAWEYAHACDGYEADTAYTLYVKDETGQTRRTYLIIIIDDASRMIVGAEFFFHDNAVNFHKVWKSAVLRYGKSKVMILDNGSSYKNGNTKDIAARLGTHLVYCKPYTPTGKAKVLCRSFNYVEV